MGIPRWGCCIQYKGVMLSDVVVPLDNETALVIDSYRGKDCSSSVIDFARQVVGACTSISPSRARALLWSCSRFARWGEHLGYELTPEVLFHPSVLERFVIVGLHTESPTLRRCARANLRYVARVAARTVVGPDALPIRREGPKRPYSQSEIDDYLWLARCQPTESRAQRLAGLVCLGAGAGLDGVDFRYVRGNHIHRRSGGVVVEVLGPRARVVPVLFRYQNRLQEVALFSGDDFVCGGTQLQRRNVTNPLISRLAGGIDLPRLEVARLRATWLCEQAQRFDLSVLLAVTGLKRSSRLGDLIDGTHRADESEVVALCGGTS